MKTSDTYLCPFSILAWFTTADGVVRQRWGQHQVLGFLVRPLVLDPTTAAPLTITLDYQPVVRARLGPAGLLKNCQVR